MPENKEKLLYKDLGYRLNGILFKVHNQLGQFAREKQYGDLLEGKLIEEKMSYERECRIGDSGNIADFIIDGKILLELKAKPSCNRDDYDQAKRYLHQTNLELGILVNFRQKYLLPKRILNIKNL
jgi:GxxExxY protein